MRLLSTSHWEFREFYGEARYAILSHRWEQDEVTYQEALSYVNHPSCLSQPRSGLRKILEFRRLALAESFDWVWIDTCCIDKSSSAELSEAINSMFKWYRQSRTCFAFLSDVDVVENIELSRWFGRGWTLQELLAPSEVRIYGACAAELDSGAKWTYFGRKSTPDILARLQRRTGIPRQCILSASRILEQPVAVRMSWASTRYTTREEDTAYCLLGLFNVNMPLLYGEGLEKAFRRLQEEIIKSTDDHTIFAHDSARGVLARCPGRFGERASYLCTRLPEGFSSVRDSGSQAYAITNKGLEIELPCIRPSSLGIRGCLDEDAKSIWRVGMLDCHDSGTGSVVLLPLRLLRTHPTRPVLLRVRWSHEVSTSFRSALKEANDARSLPFEYQTMYIQ